MKSFSLILALALFSLQIQAQQNEKLHEQNLEEINDVWGDFMKAFANNDYTLMAEIHSKKLIRIGGGNNIRDYKAYIDGYKETFENANAASTKNNIELRFFERISDAKTASERGIYKLTRTTNGEEQSFYGEFHVLFKKKGGKWKIIMDYDNNNGGTVGEQEFLDAYDIDDFKPFLEEKSD